jgi:hypothetical protein
MVTGIGVARALGFHQLSKQNITPTSNIIRQTWNASNLGLLSSGETQLSLAHDEMNPPRLEMLASPTQNVSFSDVREYSRTRHDPP